MSVYPNEAGRLREQAETILRTNSRSDRYTVPSERLYPYQWNWDSGFIALGWSKLDYDRALKELESLIEGQWKNGMIPHIVFHEYEDDYAPGPLDWQVPEGKTHQNVCTSGITQPPILGTVLSRLYKDDAHKGDNSLRYIYLYKAVKAYHDWFLERRTRAPHRNLVKSLHPWESGMDNLPCWDDLIDRVPSDAELSSFERKDLKGDNTEQRPHDSDYRAYMSLVYHYKRIGYDAPDLLPQAHFRVYDLVLNSLLLRSARDMAKLSEALELEDLTYWDDQIDTLYGGLQTLWSQKHDVFLSRDAITNDPLMPITSSSFLPLFAEAVESEQVQKLVDIYWAWKKEYPFSVPTTSPDAKQFESSRYWRGPIWINTNWMISEGFRLYGHEDIAQEIKNDSLELIKRFGFYEYFTPEGSKGVGAHSFSWSAALALYWFENL